MANVQNHAAVRLLFLICLGRALGVVRSDFVDNGEIYKQESYDHIDGNEPNARDERTVHRIEEAMQAINKSGDAPRDKRALGILLQGFMEALGYTVSPIQIASLPNPTPAAQMPIPSMVPPPPGMMMMNQSPPPPPPMMMPPMMMRPPMMMMPPAAMIMPPMMQNATAPPAPPPPPPPRQRETLRLTGVFNFGNNANTSNLLNHLAQYEQIFHGNRTMTSSSMAPPASTPMVMIDPRSRPPLPAPLFVKIPLPIASMTTELPSVNTYHDNYDKNHSEDHSEEYSQGENEDKRQGYYEQEDDNSQNREEHEKNYEQSNEPEERHDDEEESEDDYQQTSPRGRNMEKEYKNNEHIENYNVENKELNDPSQVSEEVPATMSRLNHGNYMKEPKWKQQHEKHLHRVEAEEEAHAEELAEDNAERENDRVVHEDDDLESHRNREKEIADRNEEISASYEAKSGEAPNYDDEEEGYTRGDYHASGNNNDDDDDDDDESGEIASNKEDESSEKVTSKSQRNSAPKNRIDSSEEVQEEEEEEIREKEAPKHRKNYNNRKENEYRIRGVNSAVLPIQYDREKSRKNTKLRDSYGKIIEKPGVKVDERISSYFSMFKNPNTGVYDTSIIQQFDDADLINGFNRIQKEYGSPESKYEEYEIRDESSQRTKYHSENNLPRPTIEREQKKAFSETRKNLKKLPGKFEILATSSPEVAVSYGPYYSMVKHLYKPLDEDHGIVSKLGSYSTPFVTRFDSITSRIHHTPYEGNEKRQITQSKEEKLQDTTKSNEVPLPEKFTAKTLLDEAENKEFRAWPAPFDYVFDDSKRSDTVYDETPEVTPIKRPPTRRVPYKPSRPICQQDTLPPGDNANKMRDLIKNSREDRYRAEKSYRRPINSRESRRTRHRNVQRTTNIGNPPSYATPKFYFDDYPRPSSTARPTKKIFVDDYERPSNIKRLSQETFNDEYKKPSSTTRPIKRISHEDNKRPSSTKRPSQKIYDDEFKQSSTKKPNEEIFANDYGPSNTKRLDHEVFADDYKQPSSTIRPRNNRERIRTATYSPNTLEPRTPHSERTRIHEAPKSDHKKSAKTDDNEVPVRRSSGHQHQRSRATPKPTVRSPQRQDSRRRKTNDHSTEAIPSNYVEKDGVLIVPEPTPYHYDERIEEFMTEETPIDSKNVKVKEYRSKTETIKVAEMKQRHPNKPIEIIEYSRSL